MKMPFLLISPKIVPKIQLIKKGGCFEYHAVIADKIEYRYIHRASICPVLGMDDLYIRIISGTKCSIQLYSKNNKKLKQAGIIKACEGIKGGYQIAKQPENISLRDVISCTESTMAISRCLEKEGGCSKNYIAWETRRWRRCWRVWRRAWKLNKNIIMEIEQSLLALGEIQMWVDFL